MLGNGEEFNNIKNLIQELNVSDCVCLLQNKPNKEVLKLMQTHHVFLFTSDRNEGWGAVLNEAMSNACTVVASHRIGAVPFLVEHNKTGLIFKSECIDSLEENVVMLLNNRPKCAEMALNAYNSMKNDWSPQTAVRHFLMLAESALKDELISIPNGPCSSAKKQINLF